LSAQREHQPQCLSHTPRAHREGRKRMTAPTSRSTDKALIATTSNLVELLRDVAHARRRRILDIDDHEVVLWLAELPAGVSLDRDAGPGEALFSVPRVRAEAPPTLPASLTEWVSAASVRDSALSEPGLLEP